MQQATDTTQSSNGHMSLDPNPNNSNSTLIEQKEMDGTPFTAVKMHNKWAIMFGKYRLTETVDTYEECWEMLETQTWNIVSAVVIAIVQAGEEIKNKKDVDD